MIDTPLREISATPQAIRIFWELLPRVIRLEMINKLYDHKELIDRASKIHRFDEILMRRLNWRIVAVRQRPLAWRIERLESLSVAHPVIIHDICHSYLKTFHTQLIEDIRQIGNDGQPDLPSNQYPTEWYLRVIGYVQQQAPPPIACMCMFTLFSDCPGRTDAFADQRYEEIWRTHVTWCSSQSETLLPEVELPVDVPEPDQPPTPVTVAPSVIPPKPKPVRATPSMKPLEPPATLAHWPANFAELDKLVIRAINESASETNGALSHDEMERAIHQLLHLNSEMPSYFFHLGYFHGLRNVKFGVERHQSNLGQAWAYYGYLLGMWRENSELIVDSLSSHKKYWQQLLLLPVEFLEPMYHLITMFAQRDAYNHIADLIERVPMPHLAVAEHHQSVPYQIYTIAADLVRRGESADAADRILQELSRQLHVAGSERDLYARCLRKRGQYLRRKRRFAQASELFDQAIIVHEFSEVSQTYADIGLTNAKYTALDSILPGDDKEQNRMIKVALESQRNFFESALQVPYADYTNAQFILGILELANHQYAAAYEYLNEARQGMERQLEAYKARDLYDWVIFLRLRAWSHKPITDDIAAIHKDVRYIIVSDVFFPISQWLDMYHNLAKIDATVARDVMQHLFNYRDLDLYTICTVEEVMRYGASIWHRYFHSEQFIRLPAQQRYDHYINAMHIAVANENDQACEYILDLLEMNAVNNSEFAQLMITFIDDNYSMFVQMWGETDTLETQIQLLFVSGKLELAMSLMPKLCNIYIGQKALPRARAIFEWMKQLRHPDTNDYQAFFAEVVVRESHRPCRVLYIGGNETQQSFKDQIEARLSESHPHISVTWELIGWKSNWDKDAERIEREIPQHDLVVLSPYVRTLFGRHIRSISKNWRSSTGKGQGRIFNDIVDAVQSFQQSESA
ncbi:MAG: tetratricopeptide repeat protein [Roseiflexaceae bacterium]